MDKSQQFGVCPNCGDGTRLAEKDLVPGLARIHSISICDDGSPNIEWGGETEMFWGSNS